MNTAMKYSMVFFFLGMVSVSRAQEVLPLPSPKSEDYSLPEEDTVYNQENVDEVAEYPGGMAGMRTFLANNILYPADERERGIQGKVYLEFVIHKNGDVGNLRVIRSVNAAMDKEALRVVKKFPRWKPAMKNGKTVKQRYVLPISFKIAEIK